MASHMAAEVYKLFINPLNQMSQSEKRIMFFFYWKMIGMQNNINMFQ